MYIRLFVRGERKSAILWRLGSLGLVFSLGGAGLGRLGILLQVLAELLDVVGA